MIIVVTSAYKFAKYIKVGTAETVPAILLDLAFTNIL